MDHYFRFCRCQYHHMHHASRAQTSQGGRNITVTHIIGRQADVPERRLRTRSSVCSEPFDLLRFTRTVNPNEGRDDIRTSGRVKAQATLRYLVHNRWLAAAQEEGKLTIRLGERAKTLREGREPKPQAA